MTSALSSTFAESSPDRDAGYVVLMPVKELAGAKSRLAVDSNDLRRELALAFALDTLAGVSGCPLVRVVMLVTNEPRIRRYVRGCRGYRCVDDGGEGLNGAIRAAAELAVSGYPGSPLAVVMADLPALRADDLATALREVSGHRTAFVADAEGSGTTLLGAQVATDLLPAFGPNSADRHEALGAVPVRAGVPTLRQDVDTLADISTVLAMGTGWWTVSAARCVRRHLPDACGPSPFALVPPRGGFL